jgi:hypothetical protein
MLASDIDPILHEYAEFIDEWGYITIEHNGKIYDIPIESSNS